MCKFGSIFGDEYLRDRDETFDNSSKLKIDCVDSLDLLLSVITIDSTIFSLQGDHLVAECTYSSKSRQAITLGGLTTREETCLVSTLYYPRIELSLCYSLPSLPTVLQSLGIQKLMQWVFVIIVFQPLFKYRQRFSKHVRIVHPRDKRDSSTSRFEFCEIITRTSLSFHFLLSTFFYFYFFSNRKRARVQRPFHINLHGTVDTTLMITTHDHHHHPPHTHTKLRADVRSFYSDYFKLAIRDGDGPCVTTATTCR